MSTLISSFVNEVHHVMPFGFHVCMSDSSCDVSSCVTHMFTGTELEGLIYLANKFNLSFYVTSFADLNGFKICFCVYE